MNSVLTSVRSLMQMFDGKAQEFIQEIDTVHMVWLQEIQQEANRMFSSDFNAEPELMPKTPSQKKNSRRKRVSLGRQEERQARRFSKGRRSNLRGSAVKSLELVEEEQNVPEDLCPETSTQSKRPTRKKKQTKSVMEEDLSRSPSESSISKEGENKKPALTLQEDKVTNPQPEDKPDGSCVGPTPCEIPAPKVVVTISSEERLSAELSIKPESSPGRAAAKIAIAGAAQPSRRSSVRCSLKLRHSVAGLRHSMTQESVRRASRRSILKKKAARMGNSTCSSNISEDSCVESPVEEEAPVPTTLEPLPAQAAEAEAKSPEKTPEFSHSLSPPAVRITRSVAANSPLLAPSSLFPSKQKALPAMEKPADVEDQSGRRSSRSTKRKAPDTVEGSPSKRLSPPKKSQSAVRPNMKSFLHTVQKNQMLMMTPNSFGRTTTIKSFIKHNTPLKLDSKLNAGVVTKERHKLEALKKKQEQEEERMRKMEEEKKKKQDELKRKRDERLKRVFELKVKEEQKEEEKKKRIEQKMVKIDEKNDKRLAEEKAKKRVAQKRQEELELKKKLEEEAKKKKIQQEEEKKQQELMARKKAAEEEEQARKLAEARKAQELERERQAAAERERVEKEQALALQREVERAAREKEKRELEEKRKALEQKRKQEEQQRLAAKEKEAAREREAAALKNSAALNQTVDVESSLLNTPAGKGPALNVTVDVEPTSPQSYVMSPKGGSKPLIMSKNLEDYGMDQNSDDSTDDESAPRKPIPSWAEGHHLQQIIMKQYFNPPDFDSFFGVIEPPKLENIFYKSKPRYFKRTSSAVWHSPLAGAK